MVKLEKITPHTVVDITTQRTTRSCILGGISLGKYSVAVDSGNSLEVGTELRKELKTYFNLPVKFLFLTHTHNDHRNGRDAFKDTTLIINQKCKDNMPKSIRLSKWNAEIFGEKLILEEGELSVEFHHVGGHSVGFSIAYFPSEKVLFAGDLFIVGSVNLGLPFMGFYQNKPKRTGNPEEYLSAFEKFKSMDVDVIVPGHGDLVFNPKEYLDEQTSFFNDLKSFIISALDEGKNVEEKELPRLEPIAKAYTTAESSTKRSRSLQFLKNYLNWIKISFYNYYSGKFDQLGGNDSIV